MTKRLADVARKVGVSEATVSRVLNEKPGVSESTRQAVLTALDVLGYERPTKLRDKVTVPADATSADIEAAVLARERIQAILDGRAPDRIVVAGGGKLVNLVIR